MAIPHEYGLRPVVGVLRVKDYVALLTHAPESFTTQGYLMALYPIVIEVLKTTSASDPIEGIFEEQRTIRG